MLQYSMTLLPYHLSFTSSKLLIRDEKNKLLECVPYEDLSGVTHISRHMIAPENNASLSFDTYCTLTLYKEGLKPQFPYLHELLSSMPLNPIEIRELEYFDGDHNASMLYLYHYLKPYQKKEVLSSKDELLRMEWNDYYLNVEVAIFNVIQRDNDRGLCVISSQNKVLFATDDMVDFAEHSAPIMSFIKSFLYENPNVDIILTAKGIFENVLHDCTESKVNQVLEHLALLDTLGVPLMPLNSSPLVSEDSLIL